MHQNGTYKGPSVWAIMHQNGMFMQNGSVPRLIIVKAMTIWTLCRDMTRGNNDT